MGTVAVQERRVQMVVALLAVQVSRPRPPRVPAKGRAERTIAQAMHLWLSPVARVVGWVE